MSDHHVAAPNDQRTWLDLYRENARLQAERNAAIALLRRLCTECIVPDLTHPARHWQGVPTTGTVDRIEALLATHPVHATDCRTHTGDPTTPGGQCNCGFENGGTGEGGRRMSDDLIARLNCASMLKYEQQRREEAERALADARNTISNYEAALRGVHGIQFEDGYEVNVAALREDLAAAEAHREEAVRLGQLHYEDWDDAEKRLATALALLRAIHQAARTDEYGEWWTLRKWMDDHQLFNGDLSSLERLIETSIAALLATLPKGKPPQQPTG